MRGILGEFGVYFGNWCTLWRCRAHGCGVGHCFQSEMKVDCGVWNVGPGAWRGNGLIVGTERIGAQGNHFKERLIKAGTLNSSTHPFPSSPTYPRLPSPYPRLTLLRQVPYNPLLDQGYKSIGDVHSTALPDPSSADGSGERSGRWQGKNKTECGLHSNYWEMKKKFEQKVGGGGAGGGDVKEVEVEVRKEAVSATTEGMA